MSRATITEAMLRDLYEVQRLSASEIAARFDYTPQAIYLKMKQWGIPVRPRSEAMRLRKLGPPNRSLQISEEELSHLYVDLGWTREAIAEHYGCCSQTISNRLRQYGISSRAPGPPRVEISREDLERLYIEQRLSLHQIAELYGCDPTTVKNKMEEYDLETRSYAEANQIYPRYDFDGTLADKAYLLGFRMGDLHVMMMGEAGQTVVAGCPSTKQEQLDLIHSLFSPYGHVYIGNPKADGNIGIACYLNMTFDFLLPKEDAVPDWVQENEEASAGFAAGYIDAEGSFFINVKTNCASFAISSYDKNIIHWLHYWLTQNDIPCPAPIIVGRKGELRPNGTRYREDVWRVTVSRKPWLLRLIELIGPYLKHAKRRQAMEKVRLNIEERNRYHRPRGWTEK